MPSISRRDFFVFFSTLIVIRCPLKTLEHKIVSEIKEPTMVCIRKATVDDLLAMHCPGSYKEANAVMNVPEVQYLGRLVGMLAKRDFKCQGLEVCLVKPTTDWASSAQSAVKLRTNAPHCSD